LVRPCPNGKAGSFTIPDGVATIGSEAFRSCRSLTNITIPSSLTSIGNQAFVNCDNLTAVHFLGGAPAFGANLFDNDNHTTVYYLPWTTGWGPTVGGRPTLLWVPQVLTGDAGFGVKTNQFGFNLQWVSGVYIMVEACTNLVNPAWAPVQTGPITNGSFYFSDPNWKTNPKQFYRVRWLP